MYHNEVTEEKEEKKMGSTARSQFSMTSQVPEVIEKSPIDELLPGGKAAVVKKLHKVNHDNIFNKNFSLTDIDPDLQDLTPKQKSAMIDLIIDYIYLNFKKIEENTAGGQIEQDPAVVKRKEQREIYNKQRDEMFGPRRTKFYDVGIDLSARKKQTQ